MSCADMSCVVVFAHASFGTKSSRASRLFLFDDSGIGPSTCPTLRRTEHKPSLRPTVGSEADAEQQPGKGLKGDGSRLGEGILFF